MYTLVREPIITHLIIPSNIIELKKATIRGGNDDSLCRFPNITAIMLASGEHMRSGHYGSELDECLVDVVHPWFRGEPAHNRTRYCFRRAFD